MTGPDATLAEARDALRAGATTAVALTEACLAAIAAAAPLNAFVTLADRALEQAAAADAARAAGADHDLLGIPVGVKDLFCVKGLATQAGSRILEGFVPPYDSHVTQRLWDAGAVCLGKLNMDEFAMGSATDTSVFGACVSPWRRRGDTAAITAGGSSGGSAAAVAAGLCLGALGTDTGGSIRQPAAFCGVVGIKPTYGRCSRWGIVAYASSLDQAGPMAKTVRDAAILLGAIAGFDPRDSTSADRPVPAFEAGLTDDLRGLRIGVPAEYREGLGAEMAATWDRAAAMLVDAGAEIVPITLPHTKYALAAYYIIAPAEASSNLARYDGVRYGHRVDPGEGIEAMYAATRAEGFGPEVRRRILVGTYVLSAGYYDAYYLRAQKLRTLIARDFAAAFGTVDAILAPASPGPAWGFGELSDDPVAMYLQDIYTVTVNLAGLPGVSVPVGLSPHGLPLGMQLIGRPWDEGTILNAAQAIETRAGRLPAPEAWWRG